MILLSVPQIARAQGFKVEGQDARETGMGHAFVGQADDPGTIALNPAGIGQLNGFQLSGSAAMLYVLGREFDSDTPATLQSQRADDQFLPLPSLYGTYAFEGNRIRVGLGLYTLFRLAQHWDRIGTSAAPPPPPGGFGRNVHDLELNTFVINPVVSFDLVPDTLTVAAGFIMGYGMVDERSTPVFAAGPLGVQKLARLHQDVDGWGCSFNFGVHARVCEQIRVGAYYRHKMNLDLDGDFKAKSLNPIVFGGGATSFQTGEEYEFTLPGAAGVGVSWTSADRLLTINADFESDFWKQYRRVRVELDAPLTAFGVPVVTGDNLSSKPDWFNSWGARIGAQYMLASEWALRGGYFYDSTPIPGHTIEPGIPGSDRHGVALGIGYGETAWSLDFAYMIVFMVDRHVNNAATAPQNPAQTGTYSSDPEHEFVVGFTLRN